MYSCGETHSITLKFLHGIASIQEIPLLVESIECVSLSLIKKKKGVVKGNIVIVIKKTSLDILH